MPLPTLRARTRLGLLLVAGCAACQGESPGSPDNDLAFTRVARAVFDSAAYSSPSARWADIDADGDDDLYVLNGYGSLEAEPVPQPNRLYRNDDGTLTPLAEHPLVLEVTFGGSAVWGDYDNDGDPDVFVANPRGADNLLYRNGDGDLDLFTGTTGTFDFLYRNDGGRFQRVAAGRVGLDATYVSDVLWLDLDNDADYPWRGHRGRALRTRGRRRREERGERSWDTRSGRGRRRARASTGDHPQHGEGGEHQDAPVEHELDEGDPHHRCPATRPSTCGSAAGWTSGG